MEYGITINDFTWDTLYILKPTLLLRWRLLDIDGNYYSEDCCIGINISEANRNLIFGIFSLIRSKFHVFVPNFYSRLVVHQIIKDIDNHFLTLGQ